MAEAEAPKKIGFDPFRCFCFCCKIPQRVVLALLLHACLENSYNLRVVLNVAIAAMVGPKAGKNVSDVACPMHELKIKEREGGLYTWTREEESKILYAFYGGYTFGNFMWGWFADNYGARHVLGLSMISGTIITFIFPKCIQWWGPWAAVILRFLLGLIQGSLLPCISAMVSLWIPNSEKPSLGTLAYTGSTMGPIIGNSMTGVIIEQTNSWPMAFYVWSVVCAVYIVFHYIYLYSFPETHPFLTEEEYEYLKSTVIVKKKKKVPWKGILTNMPFWAVTMGHFGHNYIFYTMVTFTPTYMKEILRYDIQENALLSSLPFLSLWLNSLIIGYIANVLINKKVISRYWFNQIFGTMGQWGSSALILLAAYSGCNRMVVVTLFVGAMGLKSLYYMTMTVNVNVLSSNFGGMLYAICNGICSLTGVLGNWVIGALTTHGRLSEWKAAFWVTFGLAVVTSIFFIIFSADERQAFDYDEDEEPAEA